MPFVSAVTLVVVEQPRSGTEKVVASPLHSNGQNGIVFLNMPLRRALRIRLDSRSLPRAAQAAPLLFEQKN